MSITYPRIHSELSGQSEVTSSTLPDYRDYEAMAVAVRALTFLDVKGCTIPANAVYVTFNHATGYVPTAIGVMPVGDIGGRAWYDPATLTADNVDVCVENPPAPGESYTINLAIYYVKT
jgi:hypothetical protein